MHSFDNELVNDGPSAARDAGAISTPARHEGRAPSEIWSTARLLHLQRSAGNAGVAQLLAGDEDRQKIDKATSSGGEPLHSSTRVQMEQAFGTDFSGVRVHTGSAADASARQLGAHAYTVGDDIVFANGQHQPQSTDGDRTLAHELSHVVQQRSGPVDGTDTGGGVKVSDPSDRFEREAVSTAEKVVSGHTSDGGAAAAGGTSGASLQRATPGEEEEVAQGSFVQREAKGKEEEPEEPA